MKKNLATILLIAMAFVNLTLSIVLVFVVVPSATKTNKLVTRVMQILDLELESVEPTPELGVEDIEVYTFEQKVTVNLAKSNGDSNDHFAVFSVSLSMDKTNKDYSTKSALVSTNENNIKEIISEEFGKYTADTVLDDKEEIKEAILAQLAEYFNSDFIINISFGDILKQ